MPHYVMPFFGCEGTNDRSFLLPIIQRTFEAVAAECEVEVVVYEQDPETVVLFSGNGLSFEASVKRAAAEAENYGDGRTVLCIHKDGDSRTGKAARTSFQTAFAAITQDAELGSEVGFAALADTDPPTCHKLVALMPMLEMEAWLMADKQALVQALRTKLTLEDLDLHHPAESYGDPKAAIEQALRLAHAHGAPRMSRADLLAELGALLSPQQLAALPSYRTFRDDVRHAFRQLGYLR